MGDYGGDDNQAQPKKDQETTNEDIDTLSPTTLLPFINRFNHTNLNQQ